MSYPLEIMPRADYRVLTDFGEIIKKTKICLLRRVDGIDSNSTEEETKQFLENSIINSGRGQLSEYSLFLLGGELEEKHISVTVSVNDHISDNWIEGNDCHLSDFVERIETKKKFKVVYFYGDEIHDVEFAQPLLQENKDLTERLKNDIRTETTISLSHRSFLIHKPMIFNYWHVQLHFFDAEGNEFPPKTKLKPKHKASLVTFLRTILLKRIRFSHNIDEKCCRIDPALYRKI